LVFLLIPHIVRGQELSDLNRRAFDVGTGSSGIDLRIAAKPTTPSPSTPPAATPAVQPPAAPVTPPRQPAPAPTPSTAAPAQQTPPAQQAPQQQPVTPVPSQQPVTPATPTQPSTPQAKPGQVVLRLDPGTASPQQGSTFPVTVVLEHGQDIAAVPIQITYDPKVLQFTSVSNGDFLAKDGQQVILVHRDDPSSGKLQITAQRPPGTAGVSGNGAVFNLVFTAKAKGTGTISITVPGARNSQNQPLEVLGSQTTVAVN
jgi:general secretion pathway protein D